jgi:hypothetical protein
MKFKIWTILIITTVVAVVSPIIYDYVSWSVSLNQLYDIVFIDTDTVQNHSSFYSTLGDIVILDEDTVQITFNNKNNFGHIVNETKVWEITENFEFYKTVHVGETFISHCKENKEKSINVDIFQLKSADPQTDIILFDHYVGQLPNTAKCIHPQIIEHSFGHDFGI